MQSFLLHLIMRFRNKILLSIFASIFGFFLTGFTWGVPIEPPFNTILFVLGFLLWVGGAICFFVFAITHKEKK